MTPEQTITTPTFLEIASSILDGKYDDNLAALQEAVVQRRKDVSAREAKLNGLMLKPGDRVIMKNLSPKLLNGQTVEVVEVRKSRVAVKAIEGVTSFAASSRVGTIGGCTIPLSCVDIIVQTPA